MTWLIPTMAALAAVCFFFLVWKKPGWGLMLSPLAIAAFAVSGHAEEDNVFLYWLAALVFPLTIILVRLAPTAGRFETPWYKTFSRIVITIFWYLLLLAAMTFVFHFLGPILFIFIIIGVVSYKLSSKYSLALDILSAIGTSMRQSLPLPMALNAAAVGQNRKRERIFKDIAYWLTQGWPLSEAIRRGYPKCPPELLASIAAGEKLNQLPQTIANLQTDISEKANEFKKLPPVHPSYPVVVVVTAFFIVLGLCIFILPTFSEVISDMSGGKAHLPPSTQLLLDFARYATGRKGLNALMITVPVLAVSIYLLSGSFWKRNPQKLTLRTRLEDWIKWHLPVVHWFERTYSQVQLTEMLKIGLRGGYPVNTTLRNSMGLDVNHCFRNRMADWLTRIEQGEQISDAALQCGFDKTLVWAFDGRINKDQTVTILESLEELYRSRYAYRLNLLNSIGWPLVILGLGLFVGSVVYAMYMGVFHTLYVALQYTMP